MENSGGAFVLHAIRLIEARQGNIKVWHFAHSNKKVFTKTKNKCEYPFYLSVRLMARQAASNSQFEAL